MSKILYLALITTSDILNRKVLWVIGLTGLAIFAYFLIGMLTLPKLEELRIQINIEEIMKRAFDDVLLVISKIGNLFCIILFSILLPAERKYRTILPVMAKPIARYQFLLGKYLGGLILILLYFLFTNGVLGGMAYYQFKKISYAFYQSFILVLANYFILSAMAFMFSTFTPSVLSALMTYICYKGYLIFSAFVGSPDPIQSLLSKMIIYMLPSFDAYITQNRIFYDYVIIKEQFIWYVLHGISFAVLYLIIALYIFNKKDLID